MFFTVGRVKQASLGYDLSYYGGRLLHALLWRCVTLWGCVILWDPLLAEEVWLSSPDMLIYTLEIQSWFPLCPWGVDAWEELSVVICGWTDLYFLHLCDLAWKSASSLLVSAVVQWEQGSALLKSPKTHVCAPGGTCVLATGVVGASALQKGLLPKLNNNVAVTKARSKLECSLLH